MTGNTPPVLRSAPQEDKSRFYYGYKIVIASFFICIMMWGSRLSFGIFIGPLLDEFHWSRASTAGGFSVTWIFAGLISIFVGRLNDKYGPRVIMTIAGCLLSLGYFLISTLQNEWQLYIYYFIVNIGMSAALVPIMSTIARWFTNRRAFMSGIVLSGTGFALLIFSPLASRLIVAYGWRTSYVIISAAALVIIVLSAQILRRDPFKMNKLPYGYSEGAKRTDTSASITIGITFKEALRTHQIWIMAAIYACLYFSYNVVIAHMVLYAGGQGISLASAATILSILGVAGIAGRILMGILADRFGNKQAMLFSASLLIIAFAWLMVSKQLWMLCLFGIVCGFGHGGLAPMESTMVANIFGMKAHGPIMGIVFSGDTLGGAVGPFVAGYIYDVTQNYTLAFEICTALTVTILILTILLKPVKQLQKSLDPVS
jgi:MFS family permease